MTNETILPSLGQILRALIKISGYRGALVELGLDKNLDDLAGEAKGRQSALFDMMQGIEDACSKALAEDCGYEWAQLFREVWWRTRESIQELVQHVDASPLSPAAGRELFLHQFTIPMMADFMQLVASLRGGGDAQSWLSRPLQTWLALAKRRSGIPEEKLLSNLANAIDIDQRTIVRWLAGEPIGKLTWPYAPKVAEIVGQRPSDTDVLLLSGWLLVACAIQSLSPETRAEISQNLLQRKQQPWTLKYAISKINSESEQAGHSPVRSKAIKLLHEVEQCFALQLRNDDDLRILLEQFRQLIDDEASPALQSSYQYIHNWFSARHAALLNESKAARRLYARAVSGAWWCAGLNQQPILNEALLYAVGMGDKDAANAYWDKIFMLGLNRGPKPPLDEQEMRRIAFAFERYFHPQMAKDRIPPRMRVKGPDDAFFIGGKHLANPNQKMKEAEGRIRRTPLMMAIQEGSLSEVKQLIAAGGEPNDFIPESGEGPLSFAMRRACDRKDTIIMDYLLEFELSPETVNRPASTKRETPMKIAVEMANASAVSRLIELGADVEAPCNSMPSALCYVMTLLHGSLHRNDPTQEDAYFAGKTPADVYDAKEGAVLDVDLAKRREPLRQLANASERNRQIFEELVNYNPRPPEDHRKVIQALLSGGADANRRYRVEDRHLAEWTPTLLAAQVGDLAVFKMLVEQGGERSGDPTLTLVPSGNFERFDALWVAICHQNHSIVSYLKKQKS